MVNNNHFCKMQFGLKQETINQINSIFARYSKIDKVIVYGSRAKGNYKPYSDIDLTIVSNDLNFTTMQKIELEIDDLLLPYKFDISLFHQIESSDLVEHINRAGQLFYENNSPK